MNRKKRQELKQNILDALEDKKRNGLVGGFLTILIGVDLLKCQKEVKR